MFSLRQNGLNFCSINFYFPQIYSKTILTSHIVFPLTICNILEVNLLFQTIKKSQHLQITNKSQRFSVKDWNVQLSQFTNTYTVMQLWLLPPHALPVHWWTIFLSSPPWLSWDTLCICKTIDYLKQENPVIVFIILVQYEIHLRVYLKGIKGLKAILKE